MCNINKSETKKDIDEWVDGEGRFHRKTVIETITNPITTKMATGMRVSPMPRGFPGLWRQINDGYSKILSGPRHGLQKLNHPRIYQKPFFQEPVQSMEFPEPKQFFGNNMSDKPVIDVKEAIEKGKKILSGMGIDVEREIKNLFTKKIQKSAEELVKETNPIPSISREEMRETNKRLDEAERNLKINAKLALEKSIAKPLNQKKEVKPKWKKTKPLKKQKQKQKTQKIKKK